MKFGRSAAVLILLLSTACAAASRQVQLRDQVSRDSYSLGYEFGRNMKIQEVELNRDALVAALDDAIAGRKAAMSAEDMRDAVQQLRKKTWVLQDRRSRERSARNREEGEAFLVRNRFEDGVTTLSSGLQYKILAEGTGPVPKESDTVKVHYRGMLISGTEFDSSHKDNEPATVRVNGVIQGWAEALQLMKTGSKWRIYVPAKLAYGERPSGRIPANSTLIFDIELLSIDTAEAAQSGPEENPFPEEADATERLDAR